MTNGEKIEQITNQKAFIDTFGTPYMVFNKEMWNAEYKEPGNTIDYRRAFKIACDLLNGDILYGVDADKIHELMMQKYEVVSSSSYEEYILNHMQELDQGQYLTENCIACKYDETEEEDGEHCKKCLAGDSQFELDKEFVDSTTKNDLAFDCISRKAVIDELKRYFHDEYYQRTSIQDCRDCFIEDVLIHLPSVTLIRPKGHWIEHPHEAGQNWEYSMYECSECHDWAEDHSDYCPSCGADMREVEE